MNELRQASIDEFKAHFRGDVLLPNSAGYDEVRQIWNAMIDRRPALIARAGRGTMWCRRSISRARTI